MTYIENPKDLRDLNYNINLLIQRFNHDHTILCNDVKHTKEEIRQIYDKMGILEGSFVRIEEHMKANSKMWKFVFGLIGSVTALIGIGAIFSN